MSRAKMAGSPEKPPGVLEHLSAGQLVYLLAVLQNASSSDPTKVDFLTFSPAGPEVHSCG